jgi:hypothetical protein
MPQSIERDKMSEINVKDFYGYSIYVGEMPWYKINPTLKTLSFKLPGFAGMTIPFSFNPLLSQKETEEIVREKISGFDRYLPEEYRNDYRKRYVLVPLNL